MAALQFTEIATCGTTIFTFDMLDRRPEAGSSQPTRWMFQTHLEAILYGKTICGSTGAAYRLLQRTPGADGRAMCLRHRSTAVLHREEQRCGPVEARRVDPGASALQA